LSPIVSWTTPSGTRPVYERLLDLDFDVLLLGHGNPVPTDAKAQLRAFLKV
jgi:hypothetical protein